MLLRLMVAVQQVIELKMVPNKGKVLGHISTKGNNNF